jgi:hypothetical protein
MLIRNSSNSLFPTTPQYLSQLEITAPLKVKKLGIPDWIIPLSFCCCSGAIGGGVGSNGIKCGKTGTEERGHSYL